MSGGTGSYIQIILFTNRLFIVIVYRTATAFMRLPHRSLKSIQPLPSIYTTFPANYDNTHSSIDSGINSGTCLIRQVEDGIEVLPLERCNILSAPILSPDQEEKEVFVVLQEEMEANEKPLPRLPTSMWLRMSTRQRILALLCLQFLMLMTIGLALMAARGRSSQRWGLNTRMRAPR